ncbi:hypothetical protein ACFYWX_43805 [Streptomyces sp. NPDC002888]|uniref:MmyB family transcriptional regulator n=1 Tax=Streptomyces sp. NPDC002888 TaxID=3364668 RepID=UPI0036C4B970
MVTSEFANISLGHHLVPSAFTTTDVTNYRQNHVGDLAFDLVTLDVAGTPDQSLVILTPEPASPSAEALASWTGAPASAPAAAEDARDTAAG